jgi:SOS-response transcriptional repressor LexA
MDYGKWLDRGLEKGEPSEKTIRMQELAERLGFSNGTYLYKFINGERELSPKRIAICAEYFGEPAPTNGKKATLAHVPPQEISLPRSGIVEYPVLGVVEAGSFREADLANDVEPRMVAYYQDEIYPNARPMAWEVRGDSMNKMGLVDGTIVFGIDFQQTGGTLQNDMIVVVEQNRGGLIERSIKAVALYADRTEFQPRSHNPIHKPIIYKNGKSPDAEVRVLTLVRRGENRYF